MAKRQHLSDQEISQQLAELGQDLLKGCKVPKDIPKRQFLAALLIAYTTAVMDFNIKRMHGLEATEPPTLGKVVDEICKLFDYNGD